jgi:hypothetical protein
MWPEHTPEMAAAASERLGRGEDAWRSDPTMTAREFGRRVLGWPGATARLLGDYEGGYVSVAIVRERGGPQVRVEVARRVAGKWWSVANVVGPAFDQGPTLSIQGSHVTLWVPVPSAGTVEVTHGSRTARRAATNGVVDFDLGFVPDAPGYFLVLLKDTGERVVDAFGISLPGGDFAAE